MEKGSCFGICAYILAGGRSQRFPGDKAIVTIDGSIQLQRLLSKLGKRYDNCFVVADRADRYAPWGIESIVDFDADGGPLAGLITALEHRQRHFGDGWCLVVSCDQLIWRSSWSDDLESYVSGRSSNSSPAVHACLWPADLFSPLPGLFHTCGLHVLREVWYSGLRALRDLLGNSQFSIHWISGVECHPNALTFNSPDQLQQLLKRWGTEDRP